MFAENIQLYFPTSVSTGVTVFARMALPCTCLTSFTFWTAFLATWLATKTITFNKSVTYWIIMIPKIPPFFSSEIKPVIFAGVMTRLSVKTQMKGGSRKFFRQLSLNYYYKFSYLSYYLLCSTSLFERAHSRDAARCRFLATFPLNLEQDSAAALAR